MSKSKLFNEYGHFLDTLPEECVNDCSRPGQDASESVEHWQRKLEFDCPREQAIQYLRETGAWPVETNKYDTGLNDMSDTELSQKVLWIACNDIRESGE